MRSNERRGRNSGSHERAEHSPPVLDLVLSAVRPFLLAVLKVARLADASGVLPADVDRTLRALLDRTLEQLRQLDLTELDLDDLRFALVVFADEKLQDRAGGVEAYWSEHPWALAMFGDARGGELFYERLSALRADPLRLPVLVVYYTCLRLGFFGAYRGPDESKRDELLDELERLLESELSVAAGPLSPRAERPYEREYDQKRNTWLSALVLSLAVVSGLVSLGLWALLDMQARDLVAEQIVEDASE